MPFEKMGRRGFTLVELMVVVAIIAILATIATPNLFDFMKRARARDGANAIANSIQNARDQAMARGEVVLVNISVVSGRPTISTWRAPSVPDFDDGTSLEENSESGAIRVRNRYASVCSELGDPATIYGSDLNRVAVLNPPSASNTANMEIAEPLDPNVRVVAMSSIVPGSFASVGTPGSLDLCFAPNGRVYTSEGVPMNTRVGECDEALVVVVTSDPDTGVTPTPDQVSSVGANTSQIDNWVCPSSSPSGASARKLLFTQLDVVRDSYFVYSISVSFNGAVRID